MVFSPKALSTRLSPTSTYVLKERAYRYLDVVSFLMIFLLEVGGADRYGTRLVVVLVELLVIVGGGSIRHPRHPTWQTRRERLRRC